MKAMAMLRIFRVTRNSSYYMSSGFSSLIFMMAIFVVFAHFIACGWFSIGKSLDCNTYKTDHVTHIERM